MSEVKALLEQKAALEAQIATKQAEGKTAAVAQIHDIMGTHNLGPADLGIGLKVAGARKPRAPGKPVEIKYRDPVTGKTWTGRGKSPLWLRDDFARARCAVRPAAAVPAASAQVTQ